MAPRDLTRFRVHPLGARRTLGAPPRLRQIESRYRVLTQVRRGATERVRTVAEPSPFRIPRAGRPAQSCKHLRALGGLRGLGGCGGQWGPAGPWGWGSALADDFDGAYVALADAQDEEATVQQVVRAGNRVL